MTLIAPSILSADFGRLADEVAAAAAAGADWIHVDVMDGHFVPPITIGPLVVHAVRRATTLPLDVHLMITSPERQIAEFKAAGADRLTVHVEACGDVPRVLEAIRGAGMSPGLALKPETELERMRPFVGLIDLLLVMSVNPGWGGQSFIESSVEKLGDARRLRDDTGARFLVEVDGGINGANAARVVAAGAEVLVAGSAVFGSSKSPRPPGQYPAAIHALRS